MAAPCPAASRLSPRRATRPTPLATTRRRPSATSGPARLIGISASRCSPTHHHRPAQAAACDGAFSFMPLDPTLRQIDRSTVSAIIPCLNEGTAIGPCVAAMVALGLGEVIVVDGGSTDLTVA